MDASAKVLGPSLLDLENMDLTAMLVQSPYMLPHGVLTPPSSVRSHSDSGSSDFSYPYPHDDMSFQTDDEAMEQYFLPPTSQESYYRSSGPEHNPQMFRYATAEPVYNDQHQWMNLPMLGQHPTTSSVEGAPPSYVFPTFNTPVLGDSGASFMPPTPQSPYPYHASPQPRPQQQQGFLSPAGLHSNPRAIQYSHSRSASSMSRSCSPSLHVPKSSSAPSNASLDSGASTSSSSLLAYGIPVPQAGMSASSQMWRCAYPGCTSRALFTRGCDLRKHFNRHSKHLYCRVEGCPQSEAVAMAESNNSGSRRSSVSNVGGFSSKKDRARHEAKHNPGIRCEWQGPEGEECGRVFSRMDNMKDHVRRIHRKSSR